MRQEFCQSLKDLNFSEDFINVEDVEVLAWPCSTEILVGCFALAVAHPCTADTGRDQEAVCLACSASVGGIPSKHCGAGAFAARLEYKDRVADLRDVGHALRNPSAI